MGKGNSDCDGMTDGTFGPCVGTYLLVFVNCFFSIISQTMNAVNILNMTSSVLRFRIQLLKSVRMNILAS